MAFVHGLPAQLAWNVLVCAEINALKCGKVVVFNGGFCWVLSDTVIEY